MSVAFYLKLDGINGESVAANYKDQIQLASFKFAGSNGNASATGMLGVVGGSGAGRVSFPPIVVTKTPDVASPKLFISMCKGTHIAKGTMSLVKAGTVNKPFLTLDFTEIFITAMDTQSSSEIPTETVSFTFKSIKYSYFRQGEDGVLTAAGIEGWDVSKNSTV